MAKWFLVSAALHALAVVVSWRVTRRAFDPTEPLTVVEWSPAPGVTPARAGRGGSGRRHASAGKRPSRARAPSLRDLGIAWSRQGDVTLPSGAGATTSEEAADDPGVAEGDGIGGRGGNILGQMKGTVDYHRVYERIESALDYPSELQAAQIEGEVRARIVLDSEGRFLKGRSRFEAGSPFLRVHVVRLLRRVLAAPLRHHNRNRGRGLEVRAIFRFALVRQGSPFAEGDSGVLGNHLAFRRQSEKLFGQWDIGPISGYGPAPGFAVSPGWFVDRVRDLTSNKAEIDPLEKYRQDPDW